MNPLNRTGELTTRSSFLAPLRSTTRGNGFKKREQQLTRSEISLNTHCDH